MNRVYRLIWNRTLGVLQVTSELAHTRGGSGGGQGASPRRRRLGRLPAVAQAVRAVPLSLKAWNSAPSIGCRYQIAKVLVGALLTSAAVPALAHGGAGGDGGFPGSPGGAGGTILPDGQTPQNGQDSPGFDPIANTGITGGGGGGSAGIVGGAGGNGGGEGGPPVGGNGGDGGAAGFVVTLAPILLIKQASGVQGGDGESVPAARAVTSTISGGAAGGGGGEGGYGVIANVVGSSTVNIDTGGLITGNKGGNGGNASDLSSLVTGFPAGRAGNGGSGGDGGIGVFFGSSVQSGTLTINGGAVISGGNGGLAGRGGAGNGGNIAAGIDGGVGAGGAGVVGAGLTIINNGSITGGMSGDGATQANAITFTGGINSLELDANSSVSGNVVAFSAADTLKLGGDVDNSNIFDVSGIGRQYGGFGQFQKTGTSTWVLAGVTTAVTPWTILGGTLSISQDASLGDSSGALTLDGGTLRVTGSSMSSLTRNLVLGSQGGGLDIGDAISGFFLSQALSGTGSLTKLGDGALILTGDNTYTGGTTIAGGALIVGLLGTTGSIVGDVVNNGVLSFARADDVTFAGTVSGTGLVSQQGGTLVLTGNNTYTGGTSILAGTLQVGDGGTTGSIMGDVDNNGGTLAFNRSDAVIFSGAISGSGALRQIGAGMLTLTGDSSAFTGATGVATGTLTVDGKLGGTLAVASGATLAGIGTVGTTTMASGAILAPGNTSTPLGTLTVNGNLTLAQGSTYQVETDPAGAGNDKVHVTGTANLAGSVVHMGPNGNYAASSTYTILSADQGIHGTFGSVSSDLAFLTPSLAYGANDVNLLVQLKQVPADPGTPPSSGSGSPPDTRPIRFADAAVTGNQRAVANGLQSLPTDNDLYSRVLNLPNGAPPAVFNALSGEAHASTSATLQGVADNVMSLPMDYLRANLDAGQLSGPATAQLGMGDASALPRSAAQPVWAQVFGNWRTLGGDGNASKVSESDGGLFVGADRAVGGGWRLGGALGYTGSHSTADNLASKVDVDSYSATIYGGKAFAAGPGKINLTAGTAYTWNDVRTKRQIGVMGLDQTLKANYGASTGQVFTELGYALPLNERVTVEPFVGAAWSDLRTRGFSESGGSAALNGQSNSNDVTTTTLGLHGRTAFSMQETQGNLHATVGWRHAFGDVKTETTMAFDGGQAFTVAGAPIAHNAAVLELGADVAVTKNTTVGIAYNGQFGAGNQQNAGSVNVSWRF